MNNSGNFSNEISLAEGIANTLRERILKGKYGIGERIKEMQIAEEMKVSRTPIREAFRQLEQEGLMESVPNRGAFVRGFTKEDIGDVYAVRTAVEAVAAEWAAERITDQEIGKLEEIYELMEFYTKRRNSKKLTELNRSFHQIIYESTGSRFLPQVLNFYQDYVEQARRVTVYCDKNLDRILQEHGAVLAALKKHNSKEATEIIQMHLRNSQARAEEGLKSRP